MTPVSPLLDDPAPPLEEDEQFGPSEWFADANLAPDDDGEEGPMAEAKGEDERTDEVEEAGQRVVPVPSPGAHTREEYIRHCMTHVPYRN